MPTVVSYAVKFSLLVGSMILRQVEDAQAVFVREDGAAVAYVRHIALGLDREHNDGAAASLVDNIVAVSVHVRRLLCHIEEAHFALAATLHERTSRVCWEARPVDNQRVQVILEIVGAR